MNRPPTLAVCGCRIAILMLAVAAAAEAWAQDSSLLNDSRQQRPLTLANYSWTYQTVEPPPKIQLHDLITVDVDVKSQVISEGEVDRRKKANADAVLKDWIMLDWLSIFPSPQSRGDPKIDASLNNKYKAESELETRDAMQFRITCSVVDIRPNGNLIIEGRTSIRNNTEVWDLSLTGEIRPEDVVKNGPLQNSVPSKKVANLRICKREAGHVRDGYRRGWFLRWLDTYQPF